MLHLLVDCFGPVASVVADQSLDLETWPVAGGDPISPQVPDNACAMLRFESGLPARMRASWSIMAGEGFRFSVWGSKGRLEARAPVFPMAHDTRLYGSQEPGLGTIQLQPIKLADEANHVPGSSAVAGRPETGLLPMAAIFASMLAGIRGEGRAAPDFAQALHVQRAIAAAELSSHERRWVEMSDLLPG
jgi:predicted dehydrogenase